LLQSGESPMLPKNLVACTDYSKLQLIPALPQGAAARCNR
jgi:hypothetical protein